MVSLLYYQASNQNHCYMKLIEYLNGGVSASELAKKTGIAPAFLWQVKNGRRKMPPKYCPKIEQATGGQVTRRDLRPDDWHEIWPELKD